jgi:hypothetical protein
MEVAGGRATGLEKKEGRKRLHPSSFKTTAQRGGKPHEEVVRLLPREDVYDFVHLLDARKFK